MPSRRHYLAAKEKVAYPGFKWIGRNREENTGGGIGFLIKEDVHRKLVTVHKTHSSTTEALWVRMGHPVPIYICLFYGKQETDDVDAVTQDYDEISLEIERIQSMDGQILLIGDFNAKIAVKNHQARSRNGALLDALTEKHNLVIINNTAKCTGLWTRQHQHIQQQKAILDYVIASRNMFRNIHNMEIHDNGLHQLKSANSRSDHNTITLSYHNTKKGPTNRKPTKN